MVREINGLGGTPTTTKTTEQAPKKAGNNSTEKAAAQPGNTAGNAADGVQLSAEARTLQSLTDQIKDLPEANLERAEQIRQALESGQYQIDDLVVADKLLQSEALFGK